MRPADPTFRYDRMPGIIYTDIEPLETLRIPAILTGTPPTRLHDVYAAFRAWMDNVPNINIHMGDTLNYLEDIIFVPQLRSLRLAVMSQFFMRHPRYEIVNRR